MSVDLEPPVCLEDIARAIEVLEQIAEDRGALLHVSKDDRERLLRAAGLVAHPGRAARRQLAQAQRQKQRLELEQQRRKDETMLAKTGIRQPISVRQTKLAAPPQPFEEAVSPTADHSEEHFRGRLNVARNCYICKRKYELVHFFYDAMCPDCAEFNWKKRSQTADLSGRYALLTGGRVKIGYYAALKLLRAGAYVVVTTRFPCDAAKRFVAEDDSDAWLDRLQLHGLDLRHTRGVELFADYLCDTLPGLDYILNNACQTVRRPPGFYAHLMADERRAHEVLPEQARQALTAHEGLAGRKHIASPTSEQVSAEVASRLAGVQRAAELSQIPLAPGDSMAAAELFPTGALDEDLQQIDLRTVNSWRLKLGEVPTVELLEVQLVNAIAPFILNGRLKPLMRQVPTHDKHIVNVSAMEGVFYRAFKRDTHPHTNMAKAALNMLTRTSAADYVKDGIHMNSVDTGWITDEDPADIARRKKEDLRFQTPLDHVDAAARICDPIFSGLITGEHLWGKFLKDYQVSNW